MITFHPFRSTAQRLAPAITISKSVDTQCEKVTFSRSISRASVSGR